MGDAPADCVKVAIRLRPPSNKEKDAGEKCIIEIKASEEQDGGAVTTGSVTINDPDEKEKPAEFAFDIVFGIQTEQQWVFTCVGKTAVEQTLTGYNGTIFAYGQTGSGKSWCMSGGPGELRGIIPRVNELLFDRIAAEKAAVSTRQFLVMCSFFEIYNEIIFDLLNPVQDRTKLGAGLQVKEHPVLGIYVKDLSEIIVPDSTTLLKLMESGTKNRAVSSTMMNASSSRSHSIFTIKVHQKDDEDKSKNVFAKLNLVDLAGSERQKGTGATGQTLKEGANINKSLSALGNVINALVEIANGKKVFVPFRNSKLTRVLQESLGGNSLCTMLATLSPAACNFEETLSTLRYANRAKAIKVSATKNEEASQISRLNAEIQELKKKLLGADCGSTSGPGADEERLEMKLKFETQLADMEKMVSSTWEQKEQISNSHKVALEEALEEQRRQDRNLETECRKRFRLLQEQNDLELTIRGLIDTLQSLPKKVDADGLRSGELPRQWLRASSSIAEVIDEFRQQHTMALMFHGAFSEDLQLWVDGEEAADHSMAQAGARRALTKLETLRRECQKLCDLEASGRSRAQEFAAAVSEARKLWDDGGRHAVASELREASDANANGEGNDAQNVEGADDEAAGPFKGLTLRDRLTLEDIGRIMQLIEIQASACDYVSMGSLEVRLISELVLRGMKLLPGGCEENADTALLQSFIISVPASPAAADRPTPAKAPREERQLHEWGPEDADFSVEGTKVALEQLVDLQGLNKKKTPEELLARPPPKFVFDVALLVRQGTGFLPTLSEDWPEKEQQKAGQKPESAQDDRRLREGKLELLQHIADTVASSLGLDTIDFDPADVLKGKEVEKTLRLLQLLAIAAARERNQPDSIGNVRPATGRTKSKGFGEPGKLPSLLDAVTRCVEWAMQHQCKVRDDSGGNASPTRELDSNHLSLQERLQEAMQARSTYEERLAALQQELEQERAVLSERRVQLDDVHKAAGDSEASKAELRRQIDELRSGLMGRAQEMEASNPEVLQRRCDFEQLRTALTSTSQDKARLASEVKRLQQQQLEIDTERETMEMELKRMKLRIAEGLDGAAHNKDPDLIRLEVEKQKWDVKVNAMEEKMRQITEEEDAERHRENGLLEEKKRQVDNTEDSYLQLQVLIEERDGLRESQAILWQEKTNCDEELAYVSTGYTHLSDRLAEKSEEAREWEEQLQKYDNVLSMLQENFEKNRAHSPVVEASPPPPPPAAQDLAVAESGASCGAEASAVPAGQRRSASGRIVGEDDASSHYSEDAFEDPEED